MRWVTIRAPDLSLPDRVGLVVGETVHVLDGTSSLQQLLGDDGTRLKEAGERARRSPADVVALSAVRLLPPIPEPRSIRDYSSFEDHYRAGLATIGREFDPSWYEAPVFYFSNPAGICGPGDEVARPTNCNMLDFELEIAAVMATDNEIAGFTLMNDWSARDLQMKEMTVGLGPAKGKDFATSLGPKLVTPDELPYEDGRLHLEASVTVNGEEVALCDASKQHYTWPQIVEQAARDTELKPGDVLGSGTLGRGCLLELGPLEGERWLEPGDLVALDAPVIGTLANPVV